MSRLDNFTHSMFYYNLMIFSEVFPFRISQTGLHWQYKHSIDTPHTIWACHWVNPKHLAVCMKGCVKVYEVTTTSSRLAYTITSKKWKPVFGQSKEVRGVAVSASLPGTIMVVCEDQPYVYEFPCHEATQEKKRHKIQSDEKSPWCIVANASVAIIRMGSQRSFLVVNLPHFYVRSHIQTCFSLRDLCISSEYLLVMGEEKIVVKPLDGSMNQDLCEIQPPDGCTKYRSACFGDAAAREFYVVCELDGRRNDVYKYVWGESVGGKDNSDVPACVIGGLRWVHYRCLSLTSDRMMAVGVSFGKRVKLYQLE